MPAQTVATTISKANQTAVPSKIRRSLDLQPGDTLLWQVPSKQSQSIRIRLTPRKWGQHMKGLGKDIWQGTDAQEYVNNLREDREVQRDEKLRKQTPS